MKGIYELPVLLEIIITGWWFQTFFIVHFIYGRILPIDELIFFKIVKTTNQIAIQRTH